MRRSSEALSAADTAWLKLEQPGNPMIVVGLLGLDGALSLARLRDVVRARFLRFPPFRRAVIARDAGAARWQDESAVDLDWHLVEEALAAPASDEALQARVAQLLGAHLDPARPLWRMHLLHGWRGGDTALVVRIHHACADGTALLRVLLALTEGAPEDLHRPHRRLDAHGHGPLAAVRSGAHGAGAFARLLLLPPDPPTSLRGALGNGRCVAWSRPLPLEPLRQAAHASGATLNDLLVAAVAGALRHELQVRGECFAGMSLRALVPVDLRPPSELDALGNHFGLVLPDLPVGTAGPRDRLAATHARMDALKASAEPVVAFRLLRALGAATPRVEAPAVRLVHEKATLSLTNVAGPRARRTLAGVPIDTVLYWIPAAGGIGVGCSLISYAGAVRLAIGADAQRLPVPARLVADFERELGRLAGRVQNSR